MRIFRPLVASVLSCAALAAATTMAAPSARLAQFRQDDQTSYALSLAGDLAAKEVPAVDVVVLFDTSASQQGAFRETAIENLKTVLAGLRPEDRVQILAVDLEAKPLTENFQSANSNSVASAISSLETQAPLGSTNMEAALTAAAERLASSDSRARAIVYIGDGVSMANMLDAPTLRPIVDRLRKVHASVSSYAVGPEVNAELLAVLANHTGGNLYVAEPMVWQDEAAGVTDARAREENIRNAQAAGKRMAQWTRAAVLWPTAAQLPDVLGQAYPAPIPPLRADRDTILVGRTGAELAAPVDIRITAAGADGQTVELSWRATPEPSSQDRAFLTQIVDAAKHNDGLNLPTVGTAGLTEIARMLGVKTDQLTMLAERAASTGDRAAAKQIAQTVLRTDPANAQARALFTALQGDVVGGEGAAALPNKAVEPGGIDKAIATEAAEANAGLVNPEATPAPARPVVPPQTPPANPPDNGDLILRGDAPVVPPQADSAVDGGLLGDVGAAGSFLDEVEQERRVFVEMLEKEISNTVIEARERMAAEPQAAIQDLKLALENVRRTADLDAATRAELEDKLQLALREAQRKASLKDELDRMRDEQVAAAREMKLLDTQLMQRIEREKQLMSRFNALMDERQYVEAEGVAEIVEEIDPEGVTPRAATLWARHQRHYYLQQVARSARWAATWETLYQTELSGIPFPDNPPIIYPDAPVWEELTRRRKDRYAVDLKSEGEAERRIYGALRQPLIRPMDYTEQPLNIITQEIAEDYDIPIVFDEAALEAVASSPDVEVSLQIDNVTLRSALELLLRGQEDLTYIVDNEVLMITTEEEAGRRLQVKVYPVADLVLPIENIGMQGGGMMGGGGMGGGGMGGGGMGGGGMGGGGMGGGGMGGGGMGGGGMGGGGGGFFAVPDDLTDSAKPATNAKPAVAEKTAAPKSDPAPVEASEAPAAEASAGEPPKVRGIEIDASMAADQFWSRHFSTTKEKPEIVRRAVRDLMKQKHYDHVIAMIQAALAAGQPQSWMYESLGIALQLDNRPLTEIERAIMSACDFSTSPEELMLIARYLSHVGLEKRAVSVYQQIVKAAPLFQEAYTLGLGAAQRAEDVDGIRWATIGILEQAWPTDQQAIRNTAVRVAQATLEQLRAKGENEAADQYQSQLDAALIRDCVVRVSWSGEADIDLVVEEPSGTVCSLREPRTSSGGVVLGDSYASYEGDSSANSASFSETYVCPRGFQGEYRVRVRKVFGELVADRVTVDVYKNYRSRDEKHERQHIAVGQDDAMVIFSLDQGRRTDPLDTQQIAAAIERQDKISQAVLAQQFGQSLSDPSIAPIRDNLTPLDLRRQLALLRGGSVGFMPVIITLPEGTQLFASAVVSADRRYVRIAAAPSFTAVGNVTTFTFAGSAAETDGGGDGGGDTGDGGADGGADGGGGDGGDGGGLDF